MIFKKLKNGRHSVGVSVNADKTHVLLQCSDNSSQARIALEQDEVESLILKLMEFACSLKNVKD